MAQAGRTPVEFAGNFDGALAKMTCPEEALTAAWPVDLPDLHPLQSEGDESDAPDNVICPRQHPTDDDEHQSMIRPSRPAHRTLKRARYAIGCAVALAAFASGEAAAIPGRYCGHIVESGQSSGATQEEALQAAQTRWSSRAGALGPGYENWDSAGERALECEKEAPGTFTCKATGRPCLPPGARPKVEM